jgi:protein ImuA
MSIALHPHFPLRPARVHEVCGPGAWAFAAVACAQVPGNLLWICEGWKPEVLNPVGLSDFINPARLLLARTKDQPDALATAEEALRDGTISLVVIEITRPLDLREGRRLQLAAKTGATTGLCLIPEGMGSNAAETRWRAAPLVDGTRADGMGADPTGKDSTRMRWEIIKNKLGTMRAWDVQWDHTAHRLDVVSPVAERPGSAHAPG